MLNVVAIMGRLVAEPELRHTANDIAVTSFTLAVDRSYGGRSGERQTDFIDMVAWRNTAEFVCKYFRKGQMMAVHGSLQARSYEDKQGNKRKAVEVQVSDVSFADSKRDNSPSGGSAEDSYGTPPPVRPAFNEPAPAYSSGSSEDFEEILGDDDLPF